MLARKTLLLVIVHIIYLSKAYFKENNYTVKLFLLFE